MSKPRALAVLSASLVICIFAFYVFAHLAGRPRDGGAEDGPSDAARFRNLDGVAVDVSGVIYVADTGNHTIRKVTPAGVTTLAGLAGESGSADGKGSAARFYYPHGLALDRDGHVYVADSWNHTVRKITPDGVVTTFAGTPGTPGSSDGIGKAASFFMPFSVVLDRDSNLYVADEQNNTIRKVTPRAEVSTLAGSAGNPGSSNGRGSAARFNQARGVASDSAGNIYVADTDNHTIRKITPAGDVTTMAGLAGNPGSRDGAGTAARFRFPIGIATDSDDNVYVADTQNQVIRKITPTGMVSTLAGRARFDGSSDGSGDSARFHAPVGVATDAARNIYVADYFNNRIRKITPGGGVTTAAGAASNRGSAREFVREVFNTLRAHLDPRL